MASVRIVFLGTGDAFSAGGRLPACYLVQGGDTVFLIDCGPGILAALERAKIPPPVVDAVLLSHLHGDHVAGIPFLLLASTYLEPRSRPLAIAGPPGSSQRVLALFEDMYPGCHRDLPFALNFIDLLPDQILRLGSVEAAPFRVPHEQQGTSLGLKVRLAGRSILYSGDTGWTEELIFLSRDTDLFICECSFYQTRLPTHLDYPRLSENRNRFGAKRMVLTHLGREVLARRAEIDMELAYDGLVIEIP